MAESRLLDLYEFLQSKGHEVYFPAQKTGECKKPYLVIKDEGLSRFQQFSSKLQMYSIMAFVPGVRFGDLEPLIDRVDEEMKELFPLFVSTFFRTPSFYDDTVKGYMISSQYRNIRTV